MARAAWRVVILGGGFGGLYAARSLARRAGRDPGLAITLVDRRERFTFKPLLYDLLTDEVDEDDIAPPLERVLGDTPVRYMRGEVRSIDLEARRVALAGTAGPTSLDYDALVIALGAEPFYRGLPGLEERALPSASLEDFRRLRAHVDEVLARPEARDPGPAGERLRRIGICGAGPNGVEIACKLADLDAPGPGGRDGGGVRPHPSIVLVEASSTILPGFGEELRAIALATLESKRIALRLATPVLGATDAGLLLRNETIETATIVWTAGQRPVAAVRALPLDRDPQGRILVGATLEVARRPSVFALGDNAKCVVEGIEAPPATAQVAVQQASIVAKNILARRTGRTLSSYRYFPLAETLSLGRGSDALHVLGLKLGGRAGHVARRLVYLARLPTWRQTAVVGARWGARWAVDALSAGAARVFGRP